MAGLIGTIKTALFGAQNPVRWLKRTFTSSAEQLDPKESDVRQVVPPLGGHRNPPGAGELAEGTSHVHPRDES